MWPRPWTPLPREREHQCLIQYVDGTLDTDSLSEADVEELRNHEGIKEIRRLRGYSKIALEQSELQFKEVISS